MDFFCFTFLYILSVPYYFYNWKKIKQVCQRCVAGYKTRAAAAHTGWHGPRFLTTEGKCPNYKEMDEEPRWVFFILIFLIKLQGEGAAE